MNEAAMVLVISLILGAQGSPAPASAVAESKAQQRRCSEAHQRFVAAVSKRCEKCRTVSSAAPCGSREAVAKK